MTDQANSSINGNGRDGAGDRGNVTATNDRSGGGGGGAGGSSGSGSGDGQRDAGSASAGGHDYQSQLSQVLLPPGLRNLQLAASTGQLKGENGILDILNLQHGQHQQHQQLNNPAQLLQQHHQQNFLYQPHHLQLHQQLQQTKDYSSPSISPPSPPEQKYDPESAAGMDAGTPTTSAPRRRGRPSSHSLSLPNANQDKMHKCTHCTKAFATASYLLQHTRIHLNLKPYECPTCKHTFTQLSHLQQHVRTHTGEKPYICKFEGCQKQFSQLSNLQSHSRCHQPERPFRCNSCYRCFKTDVELANHARTHENSRRPKQHLCTVCGRAYSQLLYLKKHLQQKHGDKSNQHQLQQQQQHDQQQAAHHQPTSATATSTSMRNAVNCLQNQLPLATGNLGLNLQPPVGIRGDANGFWPLNGISTANPAVTLAQAQQLMQNSGYNFDALQLQQPGQLQLQHQQQQQQIQQQLQQQQQQRLINESRGNGASGANTPNSVHSPQDGGGVEDLAIRQQQQIQQHHQRHQMQQQQQQQEKHLQPVPSPNAQSSGSSNQLMPQDMTTTSAFQPFPPYGGYQAQQNMGLPAVPSLIALRQIQAAAQTAHHPGSMPGLSAEQLRTLNGAMANGNDVTSPNGSGKSKQQ